MKIVSQVGLKLLEENCELRAENKELFRKSNESELEVMELKSEIENKNEIIKIICTDGSKHVEKKKSKTNSPRKEKQNVE